MLGKDRRNTTVAITAVILSALFVLSLGTGSYSIDYSEVFSHIAGNGNMSGKVFFSLRFPRTMMALMAGCALGLTGAVYQMVFSNPLASPDLTGVASGASLGAAVSIVAGWNSLFMRTASAFVLGLVSLAAVLLLVRIAGKERLYSYILGGIIVSSVCEAVLMYVKYTADPFGELAAIDFWTMGSLSAVTYEKMLFTSAAGILPFLFLLIISDKIAILSLGDENAAYLGVNTGVLRIILLAASTWLVASVISMTGVIAFVGLIAPHISFLILKRRTGIFYVMSSAVGGIVILAGDVLARTAGNGADLPLSILTIGFSVPVLIYWMATGNREKK